MNWNNQRSRFFLPNSTLLSYVVVSFLLTAYLFYLDEGNFNFEWMLTLGAWIVFAVYCIFFLIILLIIDAFTFRSLSNMKKVLASIAVFILFLASFVLFTAM